MIFIVVYMNNSPDGVSGECFLVERYESDVEEGEEEHILLTLSDRFLEEKDTNGVVSVGATPLKFVVSSQKAHCALYVPFIFVLLHLCIIIILPDNVNQYNTCMYMYACRHWTVWISVV